MTEADEALVWLCNAAELTEDPATVRFQLQAIVEARDAAREDKLKLEAELRELNEGGRVVLPKSVEHAKHMYSVAVFYLKQHGIHEGIAPGIPSGCAGE